MSDETPPVWLLSRACVPARRSSPSTWTRPSPTCAGLRTPPLCWQPSRQTEQWAAATFYWNNSNVLHHYGMNNSSLRRSDWIRARRRIVLADRAAQLMVRSHGPVMAKCFSLWCGFTLMVGSRVAALIRLAQVKFNTEGHRLCFATMIDNSNRGICNLAKVGFPANLQRQWKPPKRLEDVFLFF